MEQQLLLDETIEETFPASDAPSNTVVTGVRIGLGTPDAQALVVEDNVDDSRFEITSGGHVAFLRYERRPHTIVLVHTEVPPSWRGRGIANVLVNYALAVARNEGLTLVAQCPFVRAYLRKHPRGDV